MEASPESIGTVGHSWIASPPEKPSAPLAPSTPVQQAGPAAFVFSANPIPPLASGLSPDVPSPGTGQTPVLEPASGYAPQSGPRSAPEAAPIPGFFNVNPVQMPNLFANRDGSTWKPTFSAPELPKVNLFGSSAVKDWLDVPGVELAIEATFIHGVSISSLPPEARLLPIAINLDNEGRRTAQVGRTHQSQWFESMLNPANICCVSRTAFEIMWSDQADLSTGSVFCLQTLGSGIVQVSGMAVPPGRLTPLLPGVRITLCSQAGGEYVPLITLALHFKVGPGASSPQKVRPPPEVVARPLPGFLWLKCTYAKALPSEALQSLPAQHAALVVRYGVGAGLTVAGRQHQPQLFEALLQGAPETFQFISRSHLNLEPSLGEDGSLGPLRVTNLSPNLVLIDELTPLPRGESAMLRDGQTLGLTMNGNEPFVTFRLVAPLSDEEECPRFLALTAPEREMSAEEPMVESVVPQSCVAVCDPIGSCEGHSRDMGQECSAPLLESTGASPADPSDAPASPVEKDEAEEQRAQADSPEVLGPSPRRTPKQPKFGCNFLSGVTATWRKSVSREVSPNKGGS